LIDKLRKLVVDKIAITQGGSLKARSTRGSLVLATGTFIERGMKLVRNMILARLLAPEDFGLMAIVMAVLIALETFTDAGVPQAIIQNKQGDREEFLNVAWWLQFIRSLGLFIIVYPIAPIICKFYDKPELLNLLRISFFSIVAFGLASPRVAVLDKEFRFAKAIILIQGSAILGTLLTITLAFYIRNVWVLVIGSVSEGILRLILSFVLCPFRIKFSIDRPCLKELLKFSRGMLGLSFLTIISLQSDIFVLGKLVSPEQLGMYALALALAQQPAGMFGQIVGRVLFPAFAEKQDDKQALCRTVLKMIRGTIVLGVPLVALAAIFAGTILSVVYGQKYSVVAIPFGILCVTMLFRIQEILLAGIYVGIGKPHLHRRFVVLLAILIISLIYPGIMLFGLAGAAGVLLISNIVAVLMQVIWMKKVIDLEFTDYLACWAPTSWFIRNIKSLREG
jgi:O-antigen/teichoic acid export membrane protein